MKTLRCGLSLSLASSLTLIPLTPRFLYTGPLGAPCYFTHLCLPYQPDQPPTFKLQPKGSLWGGLQTPLSPMCMHVSHSTAIISASILLSVFGPFAAPKRPSLDHGNLIKSELLKLRTEPLDPLSPTHFELPLHTLPQTLICWVWLLGFISVVSGQAICD